MNTRNDFPFKASLQYGFKEVYKHFSLVIALSALYYIGSIALAALLTIILKQFLPEALSYAIAELITFPLIIPFLRFFLALYDNKTSSLKIDSSLFAQTIPVFLTTLYVSFLVLVGLCLFIIPGLVLAGRLFSSLLLVIDKNMEPKEAMGASWRLTQGHTVKAALFVIANTIIGYSGLILLGVGALYTLPATTLAEIYLYRHLFAKKGADIQ